METPVCQNMPIQETLDEIVSRIVQRFHPEKIILFGSHARGTTNTQSDVDLLVVKIGRASCRERV